MKIDWKKLIISLTAPFVAGGIGSYFTSGAINTWYATLQKPVFNPPNWVFGPVWTLLYILMGISVYLYWIAIARKKRSITGLIIFDIQLILNTLWSLVFFGLKNPLLALVVIVMLLATIFLTIRIFVRENRLAGYLLIPYILWVTFATILNFWIFILNS